LIFQIFSPLSASSVLKQLFIGAGGKTKTQLAAGLNLNESFAFTYSHHISKEVLQQSGANVTKLLFLKIFLK